MKFEIKELEKLKRNITFEMSEQDYQQQYKNLLLQSVSSNQRQKGFRKNKMSLQAAELKKSPAEKDHTKRQVIINQFAKICSENDIKPAAYPFDFELPVVLAGAPVRISLDFEVLPEFTINDTANIKLERLKTKVDQKAIDHAVNNLQKQFATWEDKEEGASAEEGDQVVIDFVGSTESGEFPGGRAENHTLELGSGNMIAGFEDGIYGMKKGEQGTVKVTFPDPYHAKELAGKPAEFKITLRSIKVMNLPEITTEFIKKIGIASGEESELRAELEKHLQRQADEAIFNKLKKNTLKKLQEANPIDLPESLINQNILQLQQEEMRRHAKRNGGNLPDDYQPDREPYVKHVTEQTHMGILIMKLAEKEKIEVSQQDLEEKIRDMAASYEKPNDLLQHYANNREAVMQLRQNILEDKAIQWIVDHATVTDKEVSFDEAIAQNEE